MGHERFSTDLVHRLVQPQAGLQHFSSEAHSESRRQPSMAVVVPSSSKEIGGQ